MRFLHTGDLHLDSAYCTYGALRAERQREMGRELLVRIFELASAEKCEMILFAGDLFDSGAVAPQTETLFLDLVKKYAIPTVVAPGNHDPYTKGSVYQRLNERDCEELYIFNSQQLQMFRIGDAEVWGYAFTSPSLDSCPIAEAELTLEEGIKIFCGHADLFSPISKYAPISLRALEEKGFDYCALGHVHNVGEHEDRAGRIRYCGTPEGRSFDELGEGGVWIVDLTDKDISCRRAVTSRRSFHILRLDVGECNDDVQMMAAAKELIGSANRGEVRYLRLYLEGAAEPMYSGRLAARKEELRELCGLAHLELVDRTLPPIRGEELMKDLTIRGEFYRRLLPMLSSNDMRERKLAIDALKIGLAAIEGNPIRAAGGGDENENS